MTDMNMQNEPGFLFMTLVEQLAVHSGREAGVTQDIAKIGRYVLHDTGLVPVDYLEATVVDEKLDARLDPGDDPIVQHSIGIHYKGEQEKSIVYNDNEFTVHSGDDSFFEDESDQAKIVEYVLAIMQNIRRMQAATPPQIELIPIGS